MKIAGKEYFIHPFPIEDDTVTGHPLKSYLRISGDSVYYFSDFLNSHGLNEQLLFLAKPTEIGSKWSLKNFFSTGLANFSLLLKKIEWVDDEIIYTYSVMDYYYAISYQPYWLNEISYNASKKCLVRMEYLTDRKNEKLVLQVEGAPLNK